MSDAVLSSAIMLLALGLFVSDRVRPDAVALIVLLLSWITGLVSFEEALSGFGSPAVIIVAAVLVIGRAVELTGAAQALTSWMVPNVPIFSVRLIGLLVMGAFLSAFMNNIAALAITMPVAVTIARDHKLAPGATLMPLAFATILGGTVTLIGTPANLIVSSVREDRLGSAFGMFDMTPVAGLVAVAGLLYLAIVGWRLAPQRPIAGEDERSRLFVFELGLPIDAARGRMRLDAVRARLRGAGASLLSVIRDGNRARIDADRALSHDDRLLVMSRDPPWKIAPKTGYFAGTGPAPPGTVTSHVSVGHGSPMIGEDYHTVAARSDGLVEFVAAGPRAARLRAPLGQNRIEAGDQLWLRGTPEGLARLIRSARLLEIDREAGAVRPGKSALMVLAIYGGAVLLSAGFGLPTTASFLMAALLICMLKLIPVDEAYRSIDLSVIVLLAAMIPVGREFNQAGGSDAIAGALSWLLSDTPLFLTIFMLCGVTMLLSAFLNNVATAIVMSQVGIEAAAGLGIHPDAALIAVLIGCSCDFLTPIGHQNNMIVMGPGGYRFRDYPKVGAPLSVIVLLATSFLIAAAYG